MCRLAAGEDLQIIEIIQRLLIRRRQVKEFEHIPRQVRGLCATSSADEKRFAASGLENLRDFGVEGEGFAPASKL